MKEQLTVLLSAMPLQPFIIEMSNGEQWEVKHPESFSVGKHFMVLIEPETDRMHDLYLLHVVAFEREPRVPSLGSMHLWFLVFIFLPPFSYQIWKTKWLTSLGMHEFGFRLRSRSRRPLRGRPVRRRDG